MKLPSLLDRGGRNFSVVLYAYSDSRDIAK